MRQSGANTVAVIEAAKANMARIAEQLPGDVHLQVIRDQSRYIYAALHEITVHLVLGSVLACLVVLLFMRSWRSTIIAGVAIPASVIATFACMWPLGFTLNSVTMLALVLMVGIVIDDAIVVLENIFRFVEEKRMPPMDAARAATAEIGLAVLATTLSLVVVFVPVSFMSSISGRFVYQFGITAAAAVLVSLLVSFTLTPTMSARLLHRERDAALDQKPRRLGHVAVPAEREREVGPELRAHLPVVGEDGALRLGGQRRRAPGVGVAHPDDRRIRHPQHGFGIERRVPVRYPDQDDAHGCLFPRFLYAPSWSPCRDPCERRSGVVWIAPYATRLHLWLEY